MPEIDKINGQSKPFYRLNQNVTQPQSATIFSGEWIKKNADANFSYKIEKHAEPIARTKEDVVEITGLRSKFVDKVIEFEGFETKEYKDANGNRTIGVGHNIDSDPYYNEGSKISEEKVYEYLAKDLKVAENKVKWYTNQRKFNQGQKEALVDLFFNVNHNSIENTDFLKHINKGEFDKAMGEMNFIKSGGEVYAALCIRRMEEIGMFYDGKHNKASVSAIQKIYDKGLKALNEKIDKTTVLKKSYYRAVYDRHVLKSEGKAILEEAKKSASVNLNQK